MLSVSQFPKGRKPSTEASFERTFADKLGVWSRHMTDANAGLPDRYIPGGNWVEFKVVVFKRDVRFGAGLSKEQRREMTVLSDNGDNVFYCALLQHDEGKFLWLVNWKDRDKYEGRYSLDKIKKITYEYPKELRKAIKDMMQWK